MSAQQSFDANSAVLNQSRAEFEASRKQVFFVDSSVPGYETLVTGLGESGEVFTIDANGNALAQIASALESVGGAVDGVHIYSHGRDGALQLGGQWIDTAAVENSAAILNRIGNALTANADILLYGCNVAKTASGLNFMERVAALTQADVAASSDVTGNKNNWTLEQNVGVIEAEPVIPTGWEAVLDATAQWGVIKADGNTTTTYTGFVSNDIVHVTGEGLAVDGGQGNDVYYLDNASGAVTINESSLGGDDTVISRVQNFTLNEGAQVETILLDDSKLDDKVGQGATGNQYTKMITGNALDNNLTAGSTVGGVTLNSGDGNDYLDAGDGNLATDGSMTTNATASTLIGGKGDDHYIVRHEKDVITEVANQGTDHVFSTAERYTLGANVENLTLLNGNSTGVGNTLNNVLKSTQGNSSLDGQAGNDTLYASQIGNDSLVGGAGNDQYHIFGKNNVIVDSAGADTVYYTHNGEDSDGKMFDLSSTTGIEHLSLLGDANYGVGNDQANRIEGNAKLASTLDGGVDKVNDTLVGGLGNDRFIIRSTGDMVIDAGSGVDAQNPDEPGGDTVEAHVTVDLNKFTSADIEHVQLQDGAGNISATAKKTYASNLVGNDGNNTLTGGNMDDTLTDQLDAVTAQTTNRLVGGLGDDVYHVRSDKTTVVENANQGTDEVHSHIQNYTLAANVENLTLHDGAQSGTGNNLTNVIDATDANGAVVLHGGVNSAGLQGDTFKVDGSHSHQIYSYNANDKFEGLDADDVLYVSYAVNGGDTMSNGQWVSYFSERGRNIGGATVIYRGNPTVTAGAGVNIQGTEHATNLVGTVRADTLIAASGTSSTLDGGKGGDYMVGSSLGDVFYVDSVGTNVVANESLRGNLGDIVVGDTGETNKNLDVIRSTVNIDLNKTYTITGVASGVQQFQGIARVELQGSAGLTAKGYADRGTALMGNSGANQLVGGREGDTLDGGIGADVMTGGVGDDRYYIDNASDKVVEKAGEGRDSLYSRGININLGSANHANVEYVENIGDKGISMTGGGNGTTNILAEEFHAGKYGDTIDGKGGADSIYGGAGNDRIFTYGDDTIHTQNDAVDANVFGGDDTLVIAKTASKIGTVDALSDFSMVEAENLVNLVANNVEVQISQGPREHTFSSGAANDSLTFDNDGFSVVVNRVSTKANVGGFDIYSGGLGNDTLNASARTEGIAFAGGAGVDQLLGGSGSDTLIADGGNDVFTTGDGHDVVKITQAAVGSTITVKDFDALMDSVNDSDLTNNGWTRSSPTQSGANATVVWTNSANQKITAVFQNTVGLDIKFGTSTTLTENGATFNAADHNPNIPHEVTAAGTNQTVTGGNSNDILKSTGSNNKLDGGAGNDQLSGGNGDTLDGGVGNDVISLNNVQGNVSVDGGADDDNILLNSVTADSSVTLAGGEGSDTLTLGSMASMQLNGAGNITSIAMDYNVLTVTDGSGFQNIVGSGDADRIDANGVTADATVTYTTNGGNDTFLGGAGDDVVYLHNLDASSSVSLSGGGGTDAVHFANQAIDITINAESAKLNGMKAVKIEGFEDYVFGNQNDKVTANINDLRGKSLDGGAGADSLVLTTGDDKGLWVKLETSGNVAQTGTYATEGSFTPAPSVTLAGFEAFDGSDNSKNYFDASAYTANGGAFQLTGGVGHDMFYLGGATNNAKVTLSGGAGDDRFHLGDVSSGASVHVDGGTDGADGDRLHFATDKQVKLTLDANANIGAVSLGGTKVTITSSGLDGYYGGTGQDTIDARNVTSVDGQNNTLVLKGCRSEDSTNDGNDVLYASKSANIISELHAGKGSDSLYGNAGNDMFILGNAAGEINDGGDYIETGGGKDTIRVYQQENGSFTYISDFDVTKDTLEDSSLLNDGWIRTTDTSVGQKGITVTYSKGTDAFALQFTNQTNVDFLPGIARVQEGVKADYSSSSGKMEIIGTAGADTIIGGSGASTVYGNGGNDNITAGNNNDSIEVAGIATGNLYVYADKDSSNDAVTPAAGGNDHITVTSDIEGGAVTIHGGLGNDQITLANITGGEVYIAGRDHSHDYDKTNTKVSDSDTVTINDISGGSVEVHTSGNKSTAQNPTWGLVQVHDISGSASVQIDTGNYNDTIRVNSISGTSVTLSADEGNDYMEVSAISGGTVRIDGDFGNDTIRVQNISGGDVTIYGRNKDESGSSSDDDTIEILSVTNGNVQVHGNRGQNNIAIDSITDGTVTVETGKDNDIIAINSISGGSVSVDADQGDNVIEVAKVSGDAQVTLRGTYYDSGATGNNSIAVATMEGGTVSMQGASGNDVFTVGTISGGTVTLSGGDGKDAFYIGDVASSAKILVDGGNNPPVTPGGDHTFDELYFTGDAALNITIGNNTTGTETAQLKIAGIESIEATGKADSIDASELFATDQNYHVIINGMAGNDTLVAANDGTLLRGGDGDDLLRVKTDNLGAGKIWIRGDAGNDNLQLEAAAQSSFTLTGGHPAGNGTSPSKAGLTNASGGVIILDDANTTTEKIESIRLSEKGNSITWDTAYSTRLLFNSGEDTLVLREGAAGSTITVSGYSMDDSIDDSALIGAQWNRNFEPKGNNTEVAYTKQEGGTTKTVKVVLEDVASYRTGQNKTLSSGQHYFSNGTDTLNVNIGAQDLYVNTGGGQAGSGYRDTVNVNVLENTDARVEIFAPEWTTGESSGEPTSHARFYAKSAAGDSIPATMKFKDYQAKDGKTYAAMETLTIGDNTASNTKIYGFSRYFGTRGNDTVDASTTTQHIEYETEGGNDSFVGGAGNDLVFITHLKDDTTMTLDGGEGTNYLLWQALAEDGYNAYRISSIEDGTGENAGYKVIKFADSVTGTVASGYVLAKNFTSINDKVDGVVRDISGSSGGGSYYEVNEGETLTAGSGNDTINQNTAQGAWSNHSSITKVEGGLGNDEMTFGYLNGGKLYVYGSHEEKPESDADDNDTIRIDGAYGQVELKLEEHMGQKLSSSLGEGDTYIEVRGRSGDDSIDVGSVANALVQLKANDGADTIRVGSVSSGFTIIDAGDGNDEIRLDYVEGGTVFAKGEEGADTFYIGNIRNFKAPNVNIFGGDNPEGEPTLNGDQIVFDDEHNGVDVRFGTYENVPEDGVIAQGGNSMVNVNSIEIINGTAHNDSLDASAMTDISVGDRQRQTIIKGGDGDDRIVGGASLQLRGGNGADLLIVSGLSNNHNVWVQGEGSRDTLNGADTLSLESLGGMGFTLEGGQERGNGHESTATGLLSDNGNIIMDDNIEVIKFANEGNSITWNSQYSTTLEFSSYSGNPDSLILEEGAAGSTITVENYQVNDRILDVALLNAGWQRGGTTQQGNDAQIVWTREGSESITVNLLNTSSADVDISGPVAQQEITENYDGRSESQPQNLLVTGSGLLVQTGSGDDTIALGASAGSCTVEAGAGNDVIEVFGVDESVLSGSEGAHSLQLNWWFTPADNGQKTLTIQSNNLSALNFRTSGATEDYSELAGDMVKLYGADNKLMASFDLDSLLNKDSSATGMAPTSGALSEGEGADKKFS